MTVTLANKTAVAWGYSISDISSRAGQGGTHRSDPRTCSSDKDGLADKTG
jgi:hypothetical protein